MAVVKEKQNSNKTVTAHARNLRIAPRKVRLVTNLIKQLPVDEAITQLRFSHKKAAGMVLKALQSAVANAQNNFSLKPEQLVIKSITCDMGPVMKRYFPRARGSAFVIRRKFSHVNIVLEAQPEKKAKSRFSVLSRKPKQVKEVVLPVADTQTKGPQIALQEPEVKKTEIIKTAEQQKSSKAQQKRRPQAD